MGEGGHFAIHPNLFNDLFSTSQVPMYRIGRINRKILVGGLGFRNLDKFNIVLLAKQGWRLITYLNLLLARVLKAKYYPSSNFLNDQLGNLLSLTWKSVWSAKGLLAKGLCWTIGKGDHISIWSDFWIPGHEVDKL
ncbi:bZIP-like protein [Gossypium australe]|uniref:BZIP-like protein n=1 Tax=Gossypium australe TaxID=47621 RepID=A0A5B6W936_9ROSI|nr:bZIP-like protein [Gossypium australe]